MSKFGYHQLSNFETKTWLLGARARAELVRAFLPRYPDGCGVVAYRGQLIAYVAPNGEIRELAPPFRKVFRRDVANAPDASNCICRTFYDPEVGGPWSLKDSPRHHPMCQFAKHSHEVFGTLMERRINGQQLRPDEHVRVEEELAGKRGNKTGPRSG